MPLNIANEQELNKYISLEISAQDLDPRFQYYNQATHSLEQILLDKKMLAEYMATRYLRDRLRQYWQKTTRHPFLKRLTRHSKITCLLPEWVDEALANNEEVLLFDSTKLSMDHQKEIRRIGLFLTAMAEEYIESVVRFCKKTGRPPKIYLDYLKGKHDYPTYELALQQTQLWEQNTLKQYQKLAKVKRVMDLPNGYYVVELQNTAALALEGHKMANCLCDDLQPYLKDVESESPTFAIYSIRNSRDIPRVDITVRRLEQVVTDCAAKANDLIHPVDAPYVAEFVNFLKLPMRIAAARQARLLESGGVYYDVFHLPKDKKFQDSYLSLEGLDLTELPNLENVVLNGSFMCAHNQLKSLKGAPRIIRGLCSFYDNPIESCADFPQQVGSVVSPIDLDEQAKQHVFGDITVIPNRVSNLVRSKLILDPFVRGENR